MFAAGARLLRRRNENCCRILVCSESLSCLLCLLFSRCLRLLWVVGLSISSGIMELWDEQRLSAFARLVLKLVLWRCAGGSDA